MRALMMLPLFLAVAACGADLSISIEGSTVFPWVKGSPTFPFREAEEEERADAILEITVKHMPTGEMVDSEVRVKRDPSIVWKKVAELTPADFTESKMRLYDDKVGVDVFLSYDKERDGVKQREDDEQVMIPFFEDRKGSAGPFSYEAIWKEANQPAQTAPVSAPR